MIHSLRNRLILSHALPLLLILPLTGLAMLYILETQILLPLVYSNLAKDATLMAEVTHSIPEIWQDSRISQAFVEGAAPYLGGRLMLIDLNGRVLASSDPSDAGLIGQTIELPRLVDAQRGQVVELQRGPLAEVFAPVFSNSNQRIGVVRMTTPVLTVSEQIYQLRYLLGGVVLVGVLAGILLGSFLAVSINRPIQRVTAAIHALEQGDLHAVLSEDSLNEVNTLAQAVNSLVDRLQALEKYRQQLLANLVHELGRPLGALYSATQALIRGADRDPDLSEDLLRGINAEISRMRRLLDDLAGLHGLVLGTLVLDRQVFPVGEWLLEVLSPWKAVADEKGLQWHEAIPEDLPRLSADPDRLAQAVGNLCSNAIKFTPKGNRVSITAGIEDNRLWIRVSDTGPGIPTEDLGKIFQPLYRGGQDARIVQGMGLGLAIARDIVIAHGGEIQVESSPGLHSHFTIWLPF